jgi:hypothetical protein
MPRIQAEQRMTRTQLERQLILISAGVLARRQANGLYARSLMAELDWSRLAETLHMRKLLPLLGPRLLQLAEEGSAGDGFAAAVDRALVAGRRQGAFLQLITARVIAMLAQAGIRCAPLKGPLLGEVLYGDLGSRLSSDIDLLVAPDQLAAAVDVVRQLGYGPPLDPVERHGLPLLHFALVHEREELPPIELHWRVHWYERSFASGRLLPPAADAAADWRPAPADELAALLLFYARDGFIDLRVATDLSAWWDAFGAGLPRGALAEVLHAYPALARVVPVALSVAERTVGLPAARVLGYMPDLGLRDRLAARLANPNPDASQSQLYAEKGLVDGLLTPPGGFGAFVRRELLPPREVRDMQARHAGRRRARSLLGRCTGVLSRYVLTLARLLRGPNAMC